MVRHVLNQWLTWNGIEKANMTEIFAAFESCDKLDIAHNAAVNVVLALRQRQGRSTSESGSPFSEAEETPTASLEGYGDPFCVADAGDRRRPSSNYSDSNSESLQPRSLTLDQRAPPETRKKRKIQFSQGSLQQPLLLPRYRQYSINSSYDYDTSLPETSGNQSSF